MDVGDRRFDVLWRTDTQNVTYTQDVTDTQTHRCDRHTDTQDMTDTQVSYVTDTQDVTDAQTHRM